MDERLQRLIPPLLNDDDLDAQSHALDEFYKLNEEGAFGPGDLLDLIEMAGRTPRGSQERLEPGQQMLVFARDIAEANGADANPAVEVIRRLMPGLSTDAKEAAFLVLSSIPTPDAVLAYVELMDGHVSEDMDVAPLAPEDFEDNPELGSMLFPAVLRLAKGPRQREPLLMMLLDFLEQEAIEPEALADYEAEFLAEFEQEIVWIREHQRESNAGQHAWKWAQPYGERRITVGVMMDVIGWWGPESLLDALEATGDLTDPLLRLARAFSLLRTGRRVDASELEWIAEHPRERYWLHIKLSEMGRGDELPAVCRDQEKLAEGHMVDWLCFNTELGREPDEIELVHVETRRSGGKKGMPVDYYFFRFRVTEDHRSKEDGWMVGMAGGYVRTAGATAEHDGGTFSHFTGWGEKPLEGHVAEYLEE